MLLGSSIKLSKSPLEGKTHKTALRLAQTETHIADNSGTINYRQRGHRERSRESKLGLFLAKEIVLISSLTSVLWCL